MTFCLIAGTIGFSFAQAPVKFGIKAGVNLATLTSSQSGSTNTTSSTTGYHVGAFAEFDLGGISIQPAVLYSTKGGHDESSSSGTSGGTSYSFHSVEDVTLNYVEVPVNILYNIPVTGLGKVFLGGGPYVAIGLSGKDNGTATQTIGNSTTTASGNSTLTFGSNQGDVKNPDYGVNVLGGVKLESGLMFSVGYGLGMANLSNVSGSTTKNSVFSASIGFSFL